MLADILHRNIGIFYKDNKWKEDIYEIIRRDAYNSMLLVKSLDKNIIRILGGTYIYFCRPDETSHGRRFDKVYYQPGIDEEAVTQIISPLVVRKVLPLYG